MRIIVYIWPDMDIYAKKITVKNMHFFLCMCYTHPGYRTSICGKNYAYYILIFTVGQLSLASVFGH